MIYEHMIRVIVVYLSVAILAQASAQNLERCLGVPQDELVVYLERVN